MAATKEDIIHWFKHGKDDGATHMIVVCDTFNYNDFPRYVFPGEDVHEKAKPGEMERIMEVYSLTLDMDYQLAEPRAFHYTDEK